MLAAIVAKAKNNIIGKDNKLIWHLPEDLKFFKEKTSGHIIIMGRKTFESLPFLLPNREHWVITTQKDYALDKVAKNEIRVFSTIEEVVAAASEVELAYVIGGAQIYSEFMPYIDKLYCTEIHADIDGDTYFPEIPKELVKVAESEIKTTEKYPWTYSFVTYEREKGNK